MNDEPILFNDALRKAAEALLAVGMPDNKVLVIRDIYGRLRVAVDDTRKPNNEAVKSLENAFAMLGKYVDPAGHTVLFRNDFIDCDVVFSDPTIATVQIQNSDLTIRLLDRQVIGQDWLLPQESGGTIPRLVFYGFKGGVGRSTALAVTAYHLAKQGKRVLLLDLDLESPGLSSLLLPPDSRADFGLVDWFVEDGVGQGDAILPRLVTHSPVGQSTEGAIRVAAAFGQDTGNDQYLPKLARVYADINRNSKVERFGDRMRRLMVAMEAKERPDVVLIDSRAGLHDLAAISIVNLSTTAYLFATGSVQTWQGYRLLFSHWSAHPDILLKFRDRLSIVHAMFPETEQETNAKQFLQDAYTLFSETIYEKIEPGIIPKPDVFNYDLKAEDAPHFPARIRWSNAFQEFSPILLDSRVLSDDMMRATFGDFLDRVDSDLQEFSHA